WLPHKTSSLFWCVSSCCFWYVSSCRCFSCILICIFFFSFSLCWYREFLLYRYWLLGFLFDGKLSEPVSPQMETPKRSFGRRWSPRRFSSTSLASCSSSKRLHLP